MDENGLNYLYVFEVGHRISARHDRDREIEGIEELGVQSRFFNQYDAASVEVKGAGFSVENTFYAVEGVPVEFRTLRAFFEEGLLDEKTFNDAIQPGSARGWIFD